MVTPVSRSFVSGHADRGKEPESKPLYLASLPTDVHNLIVPFLVDQDISNNAIPHLAALNDELATSNRRLKKKRDASFKAFLTKCLVDVERVAAYREAAQKTVEFVPVPENQKKTQEFVELWDNLRARAQTKKNIEERRFSAAPSLDPFKYLLGSVKESSDGDKTITFDGYSVTWDAKRRSFSFLRPGFSFNMTNVVKFLDATLAPGGVLFVAKEFYLGIYDLSSRSLEAPALYHLDYRFDRVTWDPKRMCLIGEKKGVVTELWFNSSSAKVQPLADPYSHLGEKVAYIAKRAFQIIIINAPLKAFQESRESVKGIWKEVLTVSCVFGSAFTATFLAVTGAAIPILVTLGFLLVSTGVLCVLFSFGSILDGLDYSAKKTLCSLKELHREKIFGQ